MALNCERRDPAHPTGEPCGECASCLRIWSGSANLDVVEIDAASNRSVDDARDLRERAMYAASQEAGYKVYIVDEAHMLTREAWNALLKILEEPPPRVVFVFATTEPQKIANTAAPVLSRLQRFDFRRIGAAAIRDRLKQVLDLEGLAADEDALALIGRYADGGMRDALSVLDQCLSLGEGVLTAERVRNALGLIGDESFAEALEMVAARDPSRVFPLVDRLMASGADLGEFMNGLADVMRALLMIGTGAVPEGLTTTLREAIDRVSGQLKPGDVLRMLALLTQAEGAIRRSSNARLVVETLLLRWAMMDRTVDLEAVLRGEQGGGGGGGGGGSHGGPPALPRAEGRTVESMERPRPSASPAPPSFSAAPAASSPASRASGETSPVPAAPPPPGGLTLDYVVASWPEVVARGKSRSLLLGTILEATVPVAVEGSRIAVAVQDGDSHLGEGLKSRFGVVEEVLRERFGSGVTMAVEAAPMGGGSAPSQAPKRLSQKELRKEKLERLRTGDPALDAAADALDLEIVDGT